MYVCKYECSLIEVIREIEKCNVFVVSLYQCSLSIDDCIPDRIESLLQTDTGQTSMKHQNTAKDR